MMPLNLSNPESLRPRYFQNMSSFYTNANSFFIKTKMNSIHSYKILLCDQLQFFLFLTKRKLCILSHIFLEETDAL